MISITYSLTHIHSHVHILHLYFSSRCSNYYPPDCDVPQFCSSFFNVLFISIPFLSFIVRLAAILASFASAHNIRVTNKEHLWVTFKIRLYSLQVNIISTCVLLFSHFLFNTFSLCPVAVDVSERFLCVIAKFLFFFVFFFSNISLLLYLDCSEWVVVSFFVSMLSDRWIRWYSGLHDLVEINKNT